MTAAPACDPRVWNCSSAAISPADRETLVDEMAGDGRTARARAQVEPGDDRQHPGRREDAAEQPRAALRLDARQLVGSDIEPGLAKGVHDRATDVRRLGAQRALEVDPEGGHRSASRPSGVG
jgi:hypothetical protein